ncbi:MAG TPA: molecular chaperone DnaJ [Candidatus Polarisedimenticolaceae bacterium]|nr:molecular chaperone DnaJ [Candidatus Polarisedimenticolaceae bacterium]
MAKRDYYEILGLSKSASADEIKRAYRKLAMKHHPDKHGGDDGPFKELGEAYEVLKDEKKRSAYDQFGHAAGAHNAGGPFNGQGGSNPFGGGFNAQGFDFSQFQGQGGGGGFGDIFDMFFQGQDGGRRQAARGADMETVVTLGFKEAIFGAKRNLSVTTDERCDHCDGKGGEPGTKIKTCDTCKGQGQVTRVQQTILGAIQQTGICPTCRGEGRIPEQKCSKCRGAGVVKQTKDLEVKIPAGIDNSQTIRLDGKGAAHKTAPNGDLYIHVQVRPDAKLQRQGQNISSAIKIGMVGAALGTEVPVDTVDGDVTLKVPAGTQSGKTFRLSERGVPGMGGRKRGDHMVTVEVEIPTKLSGKQKELLEQFAAEGTKKRKFW